MKLNEAKETAIMNLKLKAVDLGADMILGTELDFTINKQNIMIVSISGTPVLIDKNV